MDLASSVIQVVTIGLEIEKLVTTVHQNKQDCADIATRVERVRAIVECLENTDVTSAKSMINVLNDLEGAFRRALKLVKACQTKNKVWLFLRAGNVSSQLREVMQEIMNQIQIANFSTAVQQTVMYTNGYIKDPAANPKKLLKVLSMQGEQEIRVVGGRYVCQDIDIHVTKEEVEDAHPSYPTNITRGYLPPEYIADGIFSFKHDVFSFGILLLHTISKSGLRQDSTDWIASALKGEDDVDNLLGPSSRDESELKEIKRCMDIGLQCAARERTDRPNMRGIIDMLNGKKQLRKPPMGNKASSSNKGRA